MVFRDGRKIPNKDELITDVCIIGGGPTGLSIAREFINQKFSVTVLESGDEKFTHHAQVLNIARSIGRLYFDPVFTRHRLLGGSSTTWFGLCRPLDRIDFEKRDWIPYSGWPFGLEEIEPYYQRAAEVLHLPREDFLLENYLHDGQQRIETDLIETSVFQFSPPTNFREAYAETIALSKNCQILLNSNVQEILTSEDGKRVEKVVVKSGRKKTFTMIAKVFILAGGGIENPRLLLNSTQPYKAGLGNQNDLVGRYFNEHPHMFNATITHQSLDFFQGIYSPMDYKNPTSPMPPTSSLILKEEVKREQKMLNACAILVERPIYKMKKEYSSTGGLGFMRLAEIFSHDRSLFGSLTADLGRVIKNPGDLAKILSEQSKAIFTEQKVVSLRIMMETEPNPESRITLSDRRDRLGNRRVNVNWQLTNRDHEDFNRFKTALLNELEGLAFVIDEINHELDEAGWPVSMVAAKHHSGTTRMHKNPTRGVVDENSKVHGVGNLYIAGCSVFPTSGFSNPTYTLVALAIRLADHIKDVMDKGDFPKS
ncbi:MAG: GMC family oxidoreductase [Anaerolineae bacterium]|jgi:choline dehydrogenase-like flavoprotein|nr:GMC family oxidoreductase [Anaerolineae bacterium]MBT6614778.1 GMC family oxidoreductase [Deltaproteobacteria bacterium]MBT7070897.1 GMC family oxidoreductase [Anaerolineae bacterium]MBT7599790.1 GMC family oxidoreductase [Anaerolineae bacterium]